QRAQALAALPEKPLDLLVIGGGIVGAGIVRDAAMRGLRVALVEQHDFAFGTSSRSSRLLHGGIRYLAQGRVGLVHEASVEKKIIHEIAPHLAAPLPFLFPTYRANKEWLLWKLKIGVKIYDLLCSGKNLGKSSWLGTRETLQQAPGLSPDGLTGAVRYFDGLTNDARLVLDTLRSAAHHGAVLANYCRFLDATRTNRNSAARSQVELVNRDSAQDFKKSDDHSPSPGGEGWGEGESCSLWRCTASNILAGTNLTFLTKTIVNAAGPWADHLPHSRVKLRLAKGVHLVVDRARISTPDTVVMTEGKRILFAIPWGERTILGTTDTDYDGSLDRIFADATDIRYILEITNRFFPGANLSETDVISSWAGVRPLIADPHGSPSDISRSHQIRNPEPGWWDVAGGKLTTYRLMAEQTVDQIVHALIRTDSSSEFRPCRTAKEPLLPTAETRGISDILPPDFSRDIVKHFCENEWAAHLDDVMVRRAGWHYYYQDADARARQVASWMKEFLEWPDEVLAEEIKRYHDLTGKDDAHGT
ncbi:MAG TPA: glycerol-3-phosphate dehydrogenase/oxidase, partial [Verrucomicrobiae bacterium]